MNAAKSAVARPEERHFVGFRLRREPEHGTAEVLLSKRSKERLSSKVHNPILRGWVAYYWMVDVKGSFEALDARIRRKLRAILWRQWKRPGTRLRKLRQGGVDAARARAGAMNSRGPWWNAGASHMNQAVSTVALQQLGLVSLLDEHRRLARAA